MAMARFCWLALPALAAALAAGAPDNPVITLNLFRAMHSANIGQHDLENDNMADILGVLKYVHTEVLAEHQIGDRERTQRKYGIDTITRWEFKVKNNPLLVKDGSAHVNLQDFGPFVTYDYGQSTNEALDDIFQRFGDFVGAQVQVDPRFSVELPYFWCSISGFCPNLPFICMDEYEGCPQRDPPISTGRCKPDGCPGKGDKRDPEDQCLAMKKTDKALMGGHCQCDGDLGPCVDDMDPTGLPGCTYTFYKEKRVDLDELTGIKEEDCGDHVCEDWEDFRWNCANPKYRRKFNIRTMELEEFKYCVEYDIHPACTRGLACGSPACLRLKPEEREIGLPFWQGRCDPARNKLRVEWLATAFEVEGASIEHNLIDSDVREVHQMLPCVRAGGPLACSPPPGSGGPYCTRHWAGICMNCFIPGTKEPYPIAQHPYCPYDIMEREEYTNERKFPGPQCNSTRPRDLCCLYTSSCEGVGDTVHIGRVPLDDDGLALARWKQHSESMEHFLNRVIEEKMGRMIENEAKVNELAYWLWDYVPARGVTLGDVERMLEPFLNPPPEKPKPKPTTTEAPEEPEDEPEGEGGGSVPMIAYFLIVVLMVGGAGGGVFFFLQNQNAAAAPARTGVEMQGRGS